MTQEQKAKAYDEALKAAVVAHKDEDKHLKTTLERIFPELKESGDESIRKAIRYAIGQSTHSDGTLINGVSSEEALSWLEKQSEKKSTDKVEPKFHVGDIITNGKIIGKVDENENNKYHGWFGYDKDLSVHYADIPDVENWHLWTIQDAKDGDVLFTSSTASHEVFIFKGLTIEGYIECYCSYDSEDKYCKGKYHFIGKPTFKTHPATKEQRNLLLEKMREAGYEWDREKKELRKIDWNPQPGDTFRKKGTKSPIYHLCDKLEDGIHFGFVEERENGIAGGKISIFALNNEYELVERLKPVEKVIEEEFNKITELNASWSKEDEKMYRGLHNLIYSTPYCDSRKELSDWLESIKERVQHKVEWSEEDEKIINEIEESLLAYKIIVIDNDRELANYIEKEINWLKSLRPQKQWKPSEEQMEILQYLCETSSHPNEKVIPVLKSLYQELKKLREE